MIYLEESAKIHYWHLKIRAPDSCPRILSTVGRGWTSQRTLAFSGLRSTQIRTDPSDLGTATMPAHHGVGSSILEITPSPSMRSSSALTFGRMGSGTLRGVWRANGVASGFK